MIFIAVRHLANKIVYGKCQLLKEVNERCIICHDTGEKEKVYKYYVCNSSAHRSCLETWIVQKSGWQCPLCRRKIIPLPSKFRTDYLIVSCIALTFLP